MPRLRRIDMYGNFGVTGGGGGATVFGNVAVGPSYGQSAGNDDSTFNVSAGIDLDAVDLTGTLVVNAALDLDAVDMAGDLAATAAIDLDAVDLTAELVSQVMLDLSSVDVDIDGPFSVLSSITGAARS